MAHDDFNKYVMHCYVSRKAGPDIAGKTEFVTGKQFKRKSLVYQNKAIRKKPIPQLIIFCLI